MKIKRLIALYIDFAIASFITLRITYAMTSGSFNLSAPIEVQHVTIILFVSFFLVLMIFKDCIFKNGSIGKRIFKLGVFNKDGSVPKKSKLVARNILAPLIFPFEIVSIIVKNERLVDRLYNTKVGYIGNTKNNSF